MKGIGKYIINLFTFKIKMESQSHVGMIKEGLFNPPMEVITTEDLSYVETKLSTYNNCKVIVTHSGCFHADEVMACTLLKYHPEFKNYVILRSRNKDIWKKADCIVDVGGVFNPQEKKYDHHMSTFIDYFNKELKITPILLSAAGLVYKYEGKQIIESLFKTWNCYDEMKDLISSIHDKLYINLIHGIDGEDNGISQYPKCENIKQYKNSTSYGSLVSKLNPSILNSNDQSTQFKLALKLGEEIFLSEIKMLTFIYYPAYQHVKQAFENRFKIHKSGKVLLIEKEIPWKEHLFTLEEENNLKGEILFVLGQTLKEGIRVYTVPSSIGSFEFRKGIFEKWRGLDNDELKKESGIQDIIFVHRAGFIGGAQSLESAIKVVDQSLV